MALTEIKRPDSVKAQFGTGNDLTIYHSGSHSFIDDAGTGGLKIRVAGTDDNGFYKYSSDEKLGIFKPDGNVELYYDNVKKFETTSGGGTLTGHLNTTSGIIIRRATSYASNDADELIIGDEAVDANQGMTILAHGTKAGSINFGDGNNPNGHSRGIIKYDHNDDSLAFTTAITERLRIKSDGNIIPGTDDATSIGDGTTNFNSIWASTRFRGNDNVKLVLGNGQDLVIRHDGTDNLIESPTGDTLKIMCMGSSVDTADETAAKFIKDGAVELYYNNAKKFETTSTGVELPITASNGGIKLTAAGNHYPAIFFDANRSAENNGIMWLDGKWNGTTVGALSIEAGDDTTNKDDGKITFYTAQGGSLTRKMAIEQDGNVHIDDGNLVIGTAGKGIDFSAQTQSSATTNHEVLDH